MSNTDKNNNTTLSDAIFVFLHAIKSNKKHNGVKHSLMSILVLLSKAEFHERKYLSPSEICDFFGHSRQNLTPMLNTLEEMHLIERKLNKEDRRSLEVVLTDQGKIVVKENKEGFQSIINKIEMGLSEQEIKTFSSLLDKAANIIKHNE